MVKAVINQSQKIGLKQSVVFATYGLIAACLLFALFMTLTGEFRSLLNLLLSFLTSILVGISVLYASAAVLGMLAGDLICKSEKHKAMTTLVGILLAESCLLMCALAGSSVEFWANYKDGFAFFDYLGKPTIWIMLYGFIPALILGILYSVKIKKELSEKTLT